MALKSDRDRPLTEIAQTVSNSPRRVQTRFQHHRSGPTCVGCRHRKRMGDEVWCANGELPTELRPTGDAMRGCPSYALGPAQEPPKATGVRVSLAKIAARRSDR